MSLKIVARATCASLAITVASFAAQTNNASQPLKKPAPPAASTPKAENERLKSGKAMLSIAEAEAGGLQGEMRAYALLQAARAYASFDLTKAKEVLDQAYAASQANHDDTPSKTRLTQQILVALAQVAPDRAGELLPYAPPKIRAAVLNALLGHYQKNKQFERAKEMVLRLARESEFPYAAAATLMASLPKQDSGGREAIFGAALTSFKSSTTNNNRPMLGMNDLGTLVVRFWRDLPPSIVREAIDALLDQAQSKQVQEARPMQIAISSPSGSSAFNSIYEYRLQQLLPVLRQIDEPEAKRLAEKLKQLNPTLDPAGGVPGPAQAGDRKPQDQQVAVMMGSGTPFPGGAGEASAMMQQMQRASAIQARADADPQGAIEQASMLDPEPRAMALEGIARVSIGKNSSAARKAAQRLVETTASLDPERQVQFLLAAAEIYLRLEDQQAARRAIERGADAAEKLFKKDSDADNANQALKAYWPSSGAWKRLVRVAARISQDFAVELINEIPDAEIKATQRLALAADLLGAPQDPSVTIVSRKGQPTQMMMEIGDSDGGADIAEELGEP